MVSRGAVLAVQPAMDEVGVATAALLLDAGPVGGWLYVLGTRAGALHCFGVGATTTPALLDSQVVAAQQPVTSLVQLQGPGNHFVASSWGGEVTRWTWSPEGRLTQVDGLLLLDAVPTLGLAIAQSTATPSGYVEVVLAQTRLDGTTAVLHIDSEGDAPEGSYLLPATSAAAVLASAPTREGAVFRVDARGVLTLWSAAGELLHSIQAHHGAARAVAATDDGRTVVTAGDDGRVAVFAVSRNEAGLDGREGLTQVGAYVMKGACTSLALSQSHIAVGDALGHVAWLSWRP